jgi:hypothetical protein
MYHMRTSQTQDIIGKIVQAAQWWRAANMAATTKEEKAALNQQLKAIRKYLAVEIKNSVENIDDHVDMLKIERKKLIRLQAIANMDIEFAEDHIERMMTPYMAQDPYDIYSRVTKARPKRGVRNLSPRKKIRGR